MTKTRKQKEQIRDQKTRLTPDEIKKSSLMKLVSRLYVIDSKLNGDNAMDVQEYNEIIEEVWSLVSSKSKEQYDKPKVYKKEK